MAKSSLNKGCGKALSCGNAVIQVNPIITDTGLFIVHDTTLLESSCKMKEGHVLLMLDVCVLSLHQKSNYQQNY